MNRMNEALAAIVAVAIIIVLTFAVGFSAGRASEQTAWRLEAIERGLAQYCPDNGRWAWKGECE